MKRNDNMKRYLITSDSCPPCWKLHEEKGDEIEQSQIDEIDPTKDEQAEKFNDAIDGVENKVEGIPALIEKDENDTNVSVGYDEVSDRLESIEGSD